MRTEHLCTQVFAVDVAGVGPVATQHGHEPDVLIATLDNSRVAAR